MVQLYVAPRKPASVRPVKELKAFQKVQLSPGEEQQIQFQLNDEMFQYLDSRDFDIFIGFAADNTPIKVTYRQ